MRTVSALLASTLLAACAAPQPVVQAPTTPLPSYDVIIRDGTIYDGSAASPTSATSLVNGDRIVAVGAGGRGRGRNEIDARGLAVAPASSTC